MLIRLIRSMKNTTGSFLPGQILDLDDEEAKYLVLRKAAVEIDIADQPETNPEEDDTGEDENMLTEDEIAKIREEFKHIVGASDTIIDVLIEEGYQSLQSIANAEVDELIALKGIGKSTAIKIIDSANKLIEG